jgi:hypothetical protein
MIRFTFNRFNYTIFIKVEWLISYQFTSPKPAGQRLNFDLCFALSLHPHPLINLFEESELPEFRIHPFHSIAVVAFLKDIDYRFLLLEKINSSS